MPNLRFNYIPLPSTSSLESQQSSTAATATPNPATQRRAPILPPKNAANQRAGFLWRLKAMAARTPARPVDTQPTRNEEELEIQRAIDLSRASFVDDEIRRVKSSEDMLPEELTALRIVLEKSLQDHEESQMRLPVERNPDNLSAKESKQRRKDSKKVLRLASAPVREEIGRLLNIDTAQPQDVAQLRNFLDQSRIEHKAYQRRLATERSEAMSRARESAQRLKKWDKEWRKADPAVRDEFRSLIAAEDMKRDEVSTLRSVLENSLATREEEDMRRAVELSKASYEAEQLQREHDELQIAIELSLAKSPAVEDKMRSAITSSIGMSPETVRDLRADLERRIESARVDQSLRFNENRKACIRAFNTLIGGNKQYCLPKKESSPEEELWSEEELSYLDVGEDESQEQRTRLASFRTRVEDVEDDELQQQDTGMKLSPSDQMYSDMAPGVRLFRSWARNNYLKIVNTSAKNNNCMLDALMKIASGNYQENFDERAIALKAELVNKYSDEVSHTNATLSADSARKSFKYALDSINKMFGTDMDVYVIQPSDTGLPVFETGLPTTKYDEQDGATKKIPVILFNSGNHFEAVVAK